MTVLEIEAIEHLDFSDELSCDCDGCDHEAVGLLIPVCNPDQAAAQCASHEKAWWEHVEYGRVIGRTFNCNHCKERDIIPEKHFKWEPL